MSKNGWTWATVPDDFPLYVQYGALDTVLTARLVEHYWPQINADPQLRTAYDREMQTRSILWRAEKRGMRVDVGYTVRLRAEWKAEADILAAELKAVGIDNPNSNRKIEKALKDAGWEPEEFTATGAAKLDGPILKALAQTFGEIAPRVLRYKRLVKWCSAYLDALLAMKDANDRVHASINSLAAKTGRMSVTNPALQTLPRGPEIRRCIIPAEGKAILTADFDGQEARVLASYSQDPGLLQAFRDGIDVHYFTASKVYGVPIENVTKAQRQIAKNVTFAKMYGAGVTKLALTAGIPQAEAEAFVSTYDSLFPGVLGLMRKTESVGRMRLAQEGRAYIKTWGGRIMAAPEDAIFRLTNGLIQGSCADVLKQKIVDIDAAGLGDYLLMPVHDELVAEVPLDEFDDVRAAFVELMTESDAFAVPLTVHASDALANWGGDVLQVEAETAA